VELTCPLSKTTFSLNGAALKKNLSEKTQVIVLGEPGEMMGLVRAYLGHWPEPQESIQAAERRLEFFHYSAGKSHPALAEAWPLELPADTQTFFNRYLETLDIYLRSWLLPPGYEKKSFSLTQERFYRRGVRFEPAKGCLFINLIIPEGYSFCQDLQYSCQRLNEKNLPAPQGGKVVFRLKQAS
jgi:hypothetical protein